MDDLIGKKVVAIRPMTSAEREDEGWECHGEITVIVFDDGTTIFASQDEEGNGPGALFSRDSEGAGFMITAR